MVYYEDMLSKGGFGDGDDMPDGAFTTRSLYVTALNHAAEKRGSNFRVVAWDRPGMHNSCMIVRVTLDEYKELGYDRPERNPIVSDPNTNGVSFTSETDDAFEEAVDIAMDLHLDQYVTAKGNLKKGAQAKLKKAMAQELEQYQ